MRNINSINESLIPKNAVIRGIAKQRSKNLLRYLPEVINDISSLDLKAIWCIARLIVIGMDDEEIDILYQVAKRINTSDYATMQFSNSLLLLAYEARHLAAGLCLANRFWLGQGLLPSRESAIAIYQDVVKHNPALLSREAIDRLSWHCLIQAQQCYDDYLENLNNMVTLQTVTVSAESATPKIASLQSAVAAINLRFFQQHQLHPSAKLKQLKKLAKAKLTEIFTHLDYVLAVDLTARKDLNNHLGCLTAHMMHFMILTEQYQAFSKSQLLTSCEVSLRAAWHYDTLPGAVEELKNYLHRYKELSSGSMEYIVRSIKLDQQLTKRAPTPFYTEKPELKRVASLPNITVTTASSQKMI